MMSLIALWLVVGSLLAWLIPEVAGRQTSDLAGGRRAAG
jgi:hypothetical protein